MRPEQHYVQIVRLYEEHRDVEAVAVIMNDHGLSFEEVESISVASAVGCFWRVASP